MVWKYAILGGIIVSAAGAGLGLFVASGHERLWQAMAIAQDGQAVPPDLASRKRLAAGPPRTAAIRRKQPAGPGRPPPAASQTAGVARPETPAPAAAATVVSKSPAGTAAEPGPARGGPLPSVDMPPPQQHDVILHGTALPYGSSATLEPEDAPASETGNDMADDAPGDPGTGMSPREARSAVASVLLGAAASATRPSQLLGEGGSGTLLGSTLDGFWGLGQQEALQFIVEGKAPDGQQLAGDAVRVAAAAANQQVGRFADDAVQFGQDHGIKFLRNLEAEASWLPGDRPSIEVRTIDSLFQSAALDHTLFFEAGLRSNVEDTVVNAGLGYRYAVPDSRWMLGVNAFYDREFPIGHERMSIGLEASTPDFTVFGNRYIALSGWKAASLNIEEHPLSGWDIGIAGQVPRMEDLRVSLSAFHWDQKTEADLTGLKLMADYNVGPGLQLGTTLAADNGGDVEASLRLTWQFGADLFGDGEPMTGPNTDRRLAFVNRENIIRTESREIPKDYSIQFLAADVNRTNQTALAFQLSNAPLSSHFSYTIASSGGGARVTGSGLVEAGVQPVAGIDVSGLADGTLTLTLRVVSKQGAKGPAVIAEIVKSTAAAITVVVSTRSGTAANTVPIPFQLRFSQAVQSFDLASLTITNGTAENLQTTDNITWTFDVTPTGQGEVAIQVAAGVATDGDVGNDESNLCKVTYDTEGPSGYSVAFLLGPTNAASFRISGAEAGATYSYMIESSGGGTPVTGNGAITAVTQQVSGIDLSGLADGTLTLRLTLADALGNIGAPASDHMAKDAASPLISLVTPPANGYYDDL